ncbi:MAG: acyloxyacyl hydrolase [Candidatus Omnitrophica bacterium]|nr:acyloxyacyl hydrolase [Candidatus Omnitrophota bacterium]
MAKNKLICSILAIFLVLCLFTDIAWSEEVKSNEKSKNIQGIEFLTGYGLAKLDLQGSYRVIPLFIDFDFDLKTLTQKIGINPPGLLQFVLEPFLFYAFDPHSNAEIGNNFLLKIGFLPMDAKLQPYFKGGLGLLYMSQHTREQSTQFNFNEHAGIGIHYFFKKNTAFTLEYRYRHASNAGIKQPNSGINTNFIICGISQSF